MSKAKKALWDSDCSSLLTAAGLSFQQRHGSEKRSQAAADLDNILVAFDKLDEIDKLPEIFCEAVDLVLLPPLVVDSCTELVQRNSSVLEAIEHKLDSLSIEISNFSSKMGNIESCLAGLPSHSNAIASGNDISPPPGSSFKPPTRSRLSSALPDQRENLVVFGIRESRSLPETMDSVKSMLEFWLVGPLQWRICFALVDLRSLEVMSPPPHVLDPFSWSWLHPGIVVLFLRIALI